MPTTSPIVIWLILTSVSIIYSYTTTRKLTLRNIAISLGVATTLTLIAILFPVTAKVSYQAVIGRGLLNLGSFTVAMRLIAKLNWWNSLRASLFATVCLAILHVWG